MLESFNLTKEFRKISPFSFTFKPDFNVIVGENGSGKSSFLHLITNLEENKDVCIAKYKSSDFIFFDTEKQNPRVRDIQHLGASYGFALHSRFVSHGQAMLSVLQHPKNLKDSVLIVDEPEAGLSLSNQKKVFDDFKSLTKNNCQVIITTHSYVMIKHAKEVFDMETKTWMSSEDFLKGKV